VLNSCAEKNHLEQKATWNLAERKVLGEKWKIFSSSFL